MKKVIFFLSLSQNAPESVVEDDGTNTQYNRLSDI